ncbi:hypothetical protein ACEWY4_021171 [Coilia grayii]|uniref:exo-alpha-sialidase n=1 Tax=Coilia grayii TaxID=363190 RepID=A0ABD1J8A6_9TELE
MMRTGKRQENEFLKWSPPKDLMKATKNGYRSMNPCPVFSESKEELYLFFICIKDHISEGSLSPGKTRLCYVTTKDCGKTWGKLKDVTKTVGGIKLLDYKTFAVGPGHGIEVKRSWSGSDSTGSSRLLIPAYVKTMNQQSHTLVFYTDDEGKTWQAGRQLFQECGESQVAEVRVNDGTEVYLYCSARTWGKGAQQVPRLEALSDDVGGSFSKLQSLSLRETPHGCQGSVLALPALKQPPGDHGPSNTWLLYSHPTRGPEKQGESEWARKDLGIFLRESLQDGGSRGHTPWSKPHIIHHGISGYSDLAEGGREGHFACLMECGESAKLRVVFKEFDIGEIPKPAVTSLPGATSPLTNG